MCIIMPDVKSVMGKNFRSFMFYSNLKYGKIHESYLTRAVLSLLISLHKHVDIHHYLSEFTEFYLFGR